MIKEKRIESKTRQNDKLNLYLYINVVFVFACILMYYLFITYTIRDYVLLIAFSALSIIAETFLIPLPKVGAISVSFALTFSAIILTDPLTVCIISAVGVALRFPYKDGVGRVHILNTPINKTVFNVSQYIINTGTAGIIYIFINNHINFNFEFFNPIAGTASLVVYVLLNTLLMSKLMSILLKEKMSQIWKSSFYGMLINIILVSLLGIVLAFSYNSYGLGGLLLFFIPLLLLLLIHSWFQNSFYACRCIV